MFLIHVGSLRIPFPDLIELATHSISCIRSFIKYGHVIMNTDFFIVFEAYFQQSVS